ncbi:MAG: HypC/HybG/HupF family hydrogenase formation chaperone [Prolixibacteraceae bacterium]|nr:HypC/HybG/HupF family hydrogenase formation chaperone [Prolixibacteraceae bacterium]
MCLSIPAKVISVEGNMAKASVGGTIVKAGLHLVEDVKEGDYILIHTGYALEKISEEEALETLRLVKELDESVESLGKESDGI